jgi:membrane protein
VPNARVGLRNAAAGAIVAAVLWEAGKWGFTQYLSYSASYARFYGSIALIPLFLFWVYLTWLIVLFGLQVSYGLQVFSTWQPKQTGHDDEPAFVDPASILLVMGAVARRFLAGQSADASQVAEEAGLNETITRRMLDQLTDAGLLNRVADGDSDADYALAKPAEQIQALDVLSAGEALAPASTGDATMQRLRAARLDLLKDKPVSELIEEEEA